jgi:hypothetical protein
MKELAKKFKAARLQGKDTSGIEAEAENLTVTSGVSETSEAAGGWFSKLEKAVTGERDRVDETQESVSGAFPQAVDTFSEASHMMLRAAQMLGKASDRPAMPNGNDLGPY